MGRASETEEESAGIKPDVGEKEGGRGRRGGRTTRRGGGEREREGERGTRENKMKRGSVGRGGGE